MSFLTRREIFITPFYMLFEYFLLKYIFALFHPIANDYLLILTCLIGLNHFAPLLFEARKSRRITRFLTVLDGVWMWASVMFLIDIIIIYLLWSLVGLAVEIRLILLAIVPILGVYNYIKAHKLVVNERTLILENLTHDVNIAQLSDVHFGSVHHRQTIESIAARLKELEGTCDLAIISGDLASGSSAVEEDDFNALKDVKMPIIFTPGNHDYYLNIDDVKKACTNAGVIVLDGDNLEYGELNICGFKYSLDDKEMLKVDKSLIKPDKVNIFNYHVPYYCKEFAKLGFDIQLSGHTHGGQFYPAVWFDELIFKYNMGLFEENGGYIHVTTGVGSMDVPMRWGTDSEIVVLKLKKS